MWWILLLLFLFPIICRIIGMVIAECDWAQQKSNFRWYREHGYIRYDRTYLPKEEAEKRQAVAKAAEVARTPLQRTMRSLLRGIWWVVSLPLRPIHYLFSKESWYRSDLYWKKRAARLDWFAEHGYDENGRPIKTKDDPPQR